MSKLSVWVSALRLRTLPLAAASIIVGAGLAINNGVFNPLVFSLSLLTALLLQILSNLANDYGDAKTGADNQDRIGPQRAMQTGVITAKSMKNAIVLVAIISFISGVILLSVSLKGDVFSWLLFLGFGLLAIFAAITYTMGKLPYGYRAMGDVAVFLFFGLLGVLGSYYLYDLSFNIVNILPAISIGFLSASVLNINNMRDMETDKASNKITLVVLFGREWAFKYQLFLVIKAPILMALYFYLSPNTENWQYVFLIILSPFIKSLHAIKETIASKESDGESYNAQLKNMSISTFVFSLLFILVLIP